MTSVCSHSLVTACCRTGQKKKSVNPVLVLHLLSETASLTKKKKNANHTSQGDMESNNNNGEVSINFERKNVDETVE